MLASVTPTISSHSQFSKPIHNSVNQFLIHNSVNQFLICISLIALLSLLVTDNKRRYIVLVMNELVLDEELGSLIKKNEETVASVQRDRNVLFMQMEHISSRARNRFDPDCFVQPRVGKQKMSGVLMDCYSLIESDFECVNQLITIVTKLSMDNRKLNHALESSKTRELEAQNRVISLQEELLKCKNIQLESIQNTVQDAVKTSMQSEIKSYSDVLSKPTSSAPVSTLKSVKQAVQQVVREEDRSRSFVVFGLKEEKDEDTSRVVDAVLEFIGEKPRQDSVRIGILPSNSGSQQSRPRPIKVSVSSAAHVFQVLKAAKRLKDSELYGSVYICPDRTKHERDIRREAVVTLREKTRTDPDKRHFIRNGKVITVSN